MTRAPKRLTMMVCVVALVLAFSSITLAKTQLTWWVGSWKYEDGRAQRLVADFQKEHPDVDIKLIPINWEGYYDKVMSALLSKDVPDIVLIPSAFSQAFVATGSFLDVTDVLDEYGRDKFYPGPIEWTQFNGRDYGFPYRTESYGLFYNTKMFEEVGLAGAPRTWEQVKEAAIKLTRDVDGDGIIDVYGMGVPLSMRTPEHTASYFRWVAGSFGGDVVNEDATKATANSKETIAALQWFNDLFKAKVVIPSAPESDLDQIRRLFGAEKIALQMNAPWSVEVYEEEVPDLEFDVVTMPGLEEGEIGKSEALGWSIGVSAYSKESDAAIEFIKFFLRPENNAYLTEALPGVRAAANAPRFSNEKTQVFLDQLEHTIGDIAHPRVFMINEAIAKALQRLYLGENDVERVANDLNKDIQSVLDRR
jgi:multiple sugar transport system substrate-binding protein